MSTQFSKGVRRIVHVDMDAFYASVEQLDRPELKGKPVIVGANPEEGQGRGVVSTCSYEARKYGVRSAMPISQAFRLCPRGVFIAPRMHRYKYFSDQIMSILQDFTPLIEPVSIDEAYLDCTDTGRLFGSDRKMAGQIAQCIQKNTGLTASVGVAPNKYVAKIASDIQKPLGITICANGKERQFLADLPIQSLWGAGPSMQQILFSHGIQKIGQLAELEQDRITELFGRRGLDLWKLSRGIDNRPVQSHYERKSLSAEHTFRVDISSSGKIEQSLIQISEKLGYQIRELGFQFRTIQLKIRFTGFDTYTRSTTLTEPSNITAIIRERALELLRNFPRKERKVRLIGIGLSNLQKNDTAGSQLSLFQIHSLDPELGRQSNRDTVLDTLKRKYGSQIASAATLNALN